ncbi:glycosyltransferase [Methylocystis echinoides]|uniref:glycosyltransferase n=1 Tax=Methylocystis echinoides TaxID=29468 RepID=UPI002490662C|nr:glycosyltransferase [Methylocystis echinoides]
MQNREKPQGIFISHSGQFDNRRGGTQICSMEYFNTIAAADIQLRLILLDIDKRFSTRLLKKFLSTTYIRTTCPKAVRKMLTQIADEQPDFVFLNHTNLAHLAGELRSVLPQRAKIILLSHGLESTDLLHYVRLKNAIPVGGRATPTSVIAMGTAICMEASMRSDIDKVFVLSESDAIFERWIGASEIHMLPRVVGPKVLDWMPISGRFGFVGTLDHAPNLEGLVLILTALERKSLQRPPVSIRIIGGPAKTGEWLAATFRAVEYLGPVPDDRLAQEAATWNAFLHPIFCCARGASTKLADPIGWGLPIVTTSYGHRGYTWSNGDFSIAETPEKFIDTCQYLMDLRVAGEARKKVLQLLATSPSIADVAAKISLALTDPNSPSNK